LEAGSASVSVSDPEEISSSQESGAVFMDDGWGFLKEEEDLLGEGCRERVWRVEASSFGAAVIVNDVYIYYLR